MILRNLFSVLEHLLDSELDRIPQIPKRFLVSLTLRIATRQGWTNGEEAILVFFDEARKAVVVMSNVQNSNFGSKK